MSRPKAARNESPTKRRRQHAVEPGTEPIEHRQTEVGQRGEIAPERHSSISVALQRPGDLFEVARLHDSGACGALLSAAQRPEVPGELYQLGQTAAGVVRGVVCR